eukprot:6212726-Pleurochrysis_carterae.AAC.2
MPVRLRTGQGGYAHVPLRPSPLSPTRACRRRVVQVFDLLHGRRCLPVREDGRRRVNVVGLKERQVDGLEAFKALLAEAAEARVTAATCAQPTQ